MSYERQYYTNGDVLEASHLNHMEAGIKENSDSVSKLSEDIADLKENGTGTGSGATTAQANSLWAFLKKTAFAEPLTDAEINEFKTTWGITEEVEPDTPTTYTITRNLTNCTSSSEVTSISEGSAHTETITANNSYTLTGATISVTMGGSDITSSYSNGVLNISSVTGNIVITVSAVQEASEPDNPEVTLTSISATYTGGDVTVGTALTSLTGITVTATYSDGSTANVTDYTLSGEIVEGNNTITVSYSGLTTTFTVTGIMEVFESNYIAVSEIDGVKNTESTNNYVSAISQQYNVCRFTESSAYSSYLIPCKASEKMNVWNLDSKTNKIANMSKEIGDAIITNSSTSSAVNTTTGTIYDGTYTSDFVFIIEESNNEELSEILGNDLNSMYNKVVITPYIDGYILINNRKDKPLYLEKVVI